jgi:hypothetical protein
MWMVAVLVVLLVIIGLPALFFSIAPIAPMPPAAIPVPGSMPQSMIEEFMASKDLIDDATQTPADNDTDRPKTAWIGYVGDALARPIAGARITLETPSADGDPFAITDDRGKFVLLLPPDQFPLVAIEADGYYRSTAELEEGASGTYTLFRGGTLQGQVRGHIFVLKGQEVPDPEPIPAARLEIAGVNGWHAVILADDQGNYQITVPPGKLVATVRSPLHADARFVDLEIGRDEILDRDMILAAGVILDGFVLGKDTTLAGARVRVFNDIRDEADAISAERGMVKIKGLASGMARVHVVHPGYQETMWDMIIPADVIGFRRPFSLLQSQPFRLNVTDPQGNALPEARVRIRRQGITIVDTTASDQQWLSVLAAGKTYQVEARHAMIVNGVTVQYPPRIFRYTMPAEGPGELTIELRPGGRITGVVQAPNGAPVPGATILVRARDVHPDEASPPRLLQTNRAGVFRSEPFATGRWGLTISHTQLGTMTTEALVEENKTSSLGELRFPPR